MCLSTTRNFLIPLGNIAGNVKSIACHSFANGFHELVTTRSESLMGTVVSEIETRKDIVYKGIESAIDFWFYPTTSSYRGTPIAFFI
jgi:hypothetical protein